jgi:hypothetical protein
MPTLPAWVLASAILGAADTPISYTRDIRPILSENCFYCHGQDPNQRKADIRFDTLQGQKESGTITPGKPSESPLIDRIHSGDATKLMPPPKSNRKLTADQKTLLERWIAEGARFEDHWAFVPPVRPPVPEVPGITHPVDRFLAAAQKVKGIQPNPEADRRTLIRRLTLDLTGLPPTPAEVDTFANDPDPKAYDKLVDRLMASPHYGERQALPWLDASRYADSNGFQQDGDTFQWVWRDWVVRALNDNMPFDRFSTEQLAGDLLPGATPAQKVATAFNRNHLVNGEGGAIPDEQRFVIYFDRMDVTATNWLGLTLACAQCHDHKYDPITTRDYYSLMAGFNQLSESGLAGFQSSKTRVSPPFLEYPLPGQKEKIAALEQEAGELANQLERLKAEWEQKTSADNQFPNKAIRDQILSRAQDKPLKDLPEAQRKDEEKKRADREKAIRDHFEQKVAADLAAKLKAARDRINAFKNDELPKVMVMADDKPRDTFILNRGEYLKPGDKVTFGTPGFLPPLPKDAPKNRLGFARWLFAAENPLTARVAVNRLWQNLFGAGLVRTAEDFGVQGELPTHPALLDWLAVEFRENGWDMKKINRLLLTSAAYKRSARVTREQLALDPENRLLVRFPRVRLPAMVLRDVALATSGLLDRRVGGKPVYPYQPAGIWDTLAITKERDFTYPASSGTDLYRRSLYTFWRRTVGPANMFDASSRQACRVRAGTTNTPLHALTTLNDATWNEAARVLAANLLRDLLDDTARQDRLFEMVLARKPAPSEKAALGKMLHNQMTHFAGDPTAAKKATSAGSAPRDEKLDATRWAAWTQVCLAVYNLDEALTRE